METPAVMFIEMAVDMLKAEDMDRVKADLHEFSMLGESPIDGLKEKLAGQANSVEVGYLIGLYTAKALLATTVQAAKAGVSDLI